MPPYFVAADERSRPVKWPEAAGMSERPLLNRPVIRDCRLFPGLVARWEYPLQRNDMIDAQVGLSVGVRLVGARGRGSSDMGLYGNDACSHLHIG